MIEQAIKDTNETFETTFYVSGSAVTPTSVMVDVERLQGLSVVSGTSVVSDASAIAAQPCSYTITSGNTATLGQYRVLWKALISGATRQYTQYFEIVTKKTNYAPERSVLENLANIPLPEGTDISQYIKRAEAYFDSRVTGIYDTPINVSLSAMKQSAIDLLDDVIARLATGYLLQAMAAVNQNRELNALAQEMIKTAKKDIEEIRKGDLVLVGSLPDTDPSNDKVRFADVQIQSPDGNANALDSKSYFNRPYDEVANPANEVDLDV